MILLGVVVHVNNPSPQDTEAGERGELEASLSYIPYHKKKKKKKKPKTKGVGHES
jgi:hypothetical protein